jgi:hypothetical protein
MLMEIVEAINAWTLDTMTLSDVIRLINSWTDSEKYPPD